MFISVVIPLRWPDLIYAKEFRFKLIAEKSTLFKSLFLALAKGFA